MLLRTRNRAVACADDCGPEVGRPPFGLLGERADRREHRSLDRLPQGTVGGVARGPERTREHLVVDVVRLPEDLCRTTHDLREDDARVPARSHQCCARHLARDRLAVRRSRAGQRFDNGAFAIHGAGIVQADPHLLTEVHGPGYPGDRRFRGELDTAGQFSVNDKWVWGWDALLLSDKTLFQDYKINSYWQHFTDPKFFGNGITDAGTSQLYFMGRGDRSYFDARVMYFYGLSLADNQSQLPIVAPVIDYARVFAQPVLGGELSLKANITSLSRQSAEFGL